MRNEVFCKYNKKCKTLLDMARFYIDKELSSKVLFLGVSMKTKGGMTAVLVSYDKYIENIHPNLEVGK